jgi:hypothetical protein
MISSVAVSVCRQCVALSVLLFLQSNPARAQSEEIKLAADYCAQYKDSVKLSESAMVLCFDGPIRPDPQMEDQLQKLNDHGFFVIRSPGGLFSVAVKITDILLEKDATVIIHDYCLSACANYILVATNKTYVLRNSVVAWHGGVTNVRCDGVNSDPLKGYCKAVNLQNTFFQKKRDSRRIHLQSSYTLYQNDV